MNGIRRARIALIAGLTGAALFAALPGSASAGVLVASAPDCDNGATSHPFAQWGDDNSYFLAPGGDFEDGSGWWVGRCVADQEPWQGAGSGSHALSIGPGRSTVTPTMCVGLERPTMRFFA